MTEQIRFHLDENVNPAVAGALRLRDIDVTTTVDAGLKGATDALQFEFALRESRVIVTHDRDFLTVAATGRPHFGIAYCHRGTRTIGQIVAGLLLIQNCMKRDEMRNHIEFL